MATATRSFCPYTAVSQIELSVSKREALSEAKADVGRSVEPLARFAMVLDALEGLGLLSPTATFEDFEIRFGSGRTPHMLRRELAGIVEAVSP